jgi:predicted MPP superfamily phosphohydrolase
MFKTVFLSLGPVCWLVALYPFVLKTRLPKWAKIAIGAFLFVASLKFWWFRFFCDKIFQPDLPFWTVAVISVLYDFVLFLALASIVIIEWDVAVFLAKKAMRKKEAPSSPVNMGRRKFLLCGAASLAAGTAVRGIYDGMRLPDVKRTVIELDDLPLAFDGYTIVQLSDIHVSPVARAERTRGIVKIANSLNPDLVAITGDFLDGRVEERKDDFAPLGGLRAKDGVFGCTGNHEYYSRYDEWRKEFRRAGIRMLENQSVNIDRFAGGKKETVSIGGINDPVSKCSDVAEAFFTAPENAFKILLAHRPVNLKRHEENGVRLQLSGHTHGGAVWGIDSIVARVNENHVRGLYREGKIALYVNSGTGQWAGFPTRIGIMPEISLLVLKRAANGRKHT